MPASTLLGAAALLLVQGSLARGERGEQAGALHAEVAPHLLPPRVLSPLTHLLEAENFTDAAGCGVVQDEQGSSSTLHR